jgi:hypothetical protein
MKSNKIAMAILGLAAAWLWTSLAFGEESEYQIQDPVTISAADGRMTRFLARPEATFPDTIRVVDWARLELWVEPTTEDTTTFISIRVYPITTEWNPGNAVWNSPWSNPGGDFDEDIYAEYALGTPGKQSVAIDLTDLCMRWNDGNLPYFGFLVLVSESSLAPVQFLNGANNAGPWATLRISYSTLPVE